MNHRINIFVLLILIMFESCVAQQIKLDIEVFYEAQTRGSFIRYELKNNILHMNSNSEKKSVILNETEIRAFNLVIQKINLSEIENINAPSDKRFTDGALIASFKFIKNGKMFTSLDFDHGNPPKEFYDLYELFKKTMK